MEQIAKLFDDEARFAPVVGTPLHDTSLSGKGLLISALIWPSIVNLRTAI
ncbi:hypothetical protein [Endozoicomonas sp. 8E]|nr:hypothetical protein [Endozoicomonas sp. 8E]WOG28881.1 hypothetical protein P6910_04250 [Endozoicomonas sp. 8E]